MPDGKIRDYVKDNLVMLALVLGSWVAHASITYGVHTVNMRWIDSRIAVLERLELNKVSWRVDENQESINLVKSEHKHTQQQLSDVKAQISVINNKLDNIVDLIKKNNSNVVSRQQ